MNSYYIAAGRNYENCCGRYDYVVGRLAARRRRPVPLSAARGAPFAFNFQRPHVF